MSSEDEICVYSLVSPPELNFDKDSELKLYKTPPQKNGIVYGGYLRAPFIDIANKEINEKLPGKIIRAYSPVVDFESANEYGYCVTSSFEDLLTLKEYTVELGGEVEVIGLYSNFLRSEFGVIKDFGHKKFLGYDINTQGYSGILTCFFEKVELFKNEVVMMNKNGLLDRLDQAVFLINKYLLLQKTESLERVSPQKIDILKVYRISVE